jgi:hypothetical protein
MIALRSTVVLICLFIVGSVCSVTAQDTSSRTRELVAALDKTKSKSKEKRGIKIEVYVDVKNSAVVKTNPAEYSGSYTDESGMNKLSLGVSADGSVTGTGSDAEEEGQARNYTLRDAHINGALLTATKIYADGHTEKLEAVFTNRTVRSGENEKNARVTEEGFGLGYIVTHDQSTGRVFLKRN